MNETSDKSKDDTSVQEALANFQQQLKEGDEALSCLASRSLVFNLFVYVVMDGALDEEIKNNIDQTFKLALETMPDGEFKRWINYRYHRFKKLCRLVEQNHPNVGYAFNIESDSGIQALEEVSA